MTLLPDKHVPTRRSLVGIGALLLDRMESSVTVSSLWEMVKDEPGVGNFRLFVMSIDYLYAIGAIDYENGFLRKAIR